MISSDLPKSKSYWCDTNNQDTLLHVLNNWWATIRCHSYHTTWCNDYLQCILCNRRVALFWVVQSHTFGKRSLSPACLFCCILLFCIGKRTMNTCHWSRLGKGPWGLLVDNFVLDKTCCCAVCSRSSWHRSHSKVAKHGRLFRTA